jgi:predicted outer membrane repeat protein
MNQRAKLRDSFSRSLRRYLLILCLVVIGKQSAEAGTFNVNSTADILNPPAGVVTLRSAIQAANSTAGGNTINLTLPGTYRITLPGANTGTNASGAFAILPGGGDLSIINTSGGVVVVDAGRLDRVFDINPKFDPASPTPAFTVTMQGFTVTQGLTSVTPGGGGIAARGNTSLTLTNMVVTLNEEGHNGSGGGIFMGSPTGSFGWTLTLNNSTISNNFAQLGGGIATEGSGNVVINAGSTITGNSSLFFGGGIALNRVQAGMVDQSANLTIQDADIGSNHVIESNFGISPGDDGGGIINFGNGAVVISNSTVHDNSADNGGGLADQHGQGSLSVSNTHFVNNNARTSGGAIFSGALSVSIAFSEIDGNSSVFPGGGVFASGVTFSLQNSTVANNISQDHGGGIELRTTGSGVNGSQITNSTITGNKALGTAGIDASFASFTGSLILLGDTISSNFGSAVGGVEWSGTNGSSVIVQNTIIANNHNESGTQPLVDAVNGAGAFIDNGGNLIGVSGTGGGNTGFTNATTQTGTTSAPLDPVLGPLQDNGGPHPDPRAALR